jgi:2-dehydro-3-deoxyglucarate aldolase/4-hydroxy-2-oxoheptanedioate aldolase
MGAQLKALLGQDRLIRVFGLGQLCHPKLVEMVGWHGGFDAVWFDHEHAGLSTAQVEEAARAARGCGLDSFVRLAATDYATVMRALEAGAGGVMASMVRSARQAEEIVSWAKFHPRGQRGVNGTGADGRYGTLPLAEYFRRANAESVVAVQIEHVDAVEDVERIAAVPDLDFLFIGPADLSQSMGLPGQWDHPRVWQAVERVAGAARERRLPWAILPLSAAHARRCVELGCRILSIGIDAWAFQKGLAATRNDFAEFFPAG